MENIIESTVNAEPVVNVEPQQTNEPVETQVQIPEGNPQQTQVQDPQTNAAFAEMRRAREAAEARARKADELISKVYAEQGYKSLDDLDRAYQEYQENQQRQQFEAAGLNPDLINQLIENHPAVQQSKQFLTKQQEEQRLDNEAAELFKEFPDLNPEDIPREVFIENKKTGIPLVYLYARHAAKNAITIAEQKTIKGLQQNAQSSPGALSSPGVDNTPSVSSMSKADFESLIEKIKRGEVTSL